jgi:hypothetical protein
MKPHLHGAGGHTSVALAVNEPVVLPYLVENIANHRDRGVQLLARDYIASRPASLPQPPRHQAAPRGSVAGVEIIPSVDALRAICGSLGGRGGTQLCGDPGTLPRHSARRRVG